MGGESALTSRSQLEKIKPTDFRGFTTGISWGGVAIIFQNIDFCMINIVNLQTDMNTKILNIYFFAGVERLTITFEYVGCK